jgi:hypothetical protein
MYHRRMSLLVAAGAAMGAGTALAQNNAQSDQQRSYAQELLADGFRQTSALAPQGGGPTVRMGGQLQFRYVANFRDDVAGDEDTAIGFQARRTRLWARGNLDDVWGFRVTTDFGRSGGGASLLDAFATMKTDGGWEFVFGQTKLPFLREELVSSTRQLAADRSITNSVFTAGRAQGVWARYSDENMRFHAAFSDGARSINTDFTSAAEADWALTGRFEYLFAGDRWGALDDFTGWHGDDFAGMAGGAVHYQSGGDSFNTADVDIFSATADVQVKGNAWNAFGAVVWRNIDPDGADSADDLGFIVQGGWMPAEQFELFARWDSILADNESDFNTLTAGVNYFFSERSHAAKFTADVQWFFDTQADSLAPASTSTALLADPNDNQVALRLQLQIVF